VVEGFSTEVKKLMTEREQSEESKVSMKVLSYCLIDS
jgi:hypothetical protein